MYFKNDNDEHKDLFLTLKEKAGQGDDCEYTAALYVIAAIGKPIRASILKSGINFSEWFKEAEIWSSSERSLLRLAATLFNASTWPVTIEDVFYSLDEDNVRVALQALEIRYLMR
ncbi:hypothetical protein [uncultured Aminobacterium sp.]|jgi:hypothetical protein|uniref:hypothetical protein n=1 Tax=uncultured Aminobacterium sp. TaxID=548265 RepID=UPI002598D931|nr:hypothetical protein [uncultured Aminobacterium sp.]